MVGLIEGITYKTHSLNLAPAQGLLVYTGKGYRSAQPRR